MKTNAKRWEKTASYNEDSEGKAMSTNVRKKTSKEDRRM